MAKLSNINGKFAVEDTGAIRFSDQTGTTGQILKSNGNAAPTWVDPNTVGTGPWLPLAGGIVSGATTFQSSLTVGGVLTGTTASFNAGATNVVATFTSTDGIAGIALVDSSGNVELSASGNTFQVQPAGGVAALTVSSTNATFAGSVAVTQNSGSLEFSNTGSGHGSITTGLSKDLNIGAASGNVYINNNATFSGSVSATGVIFANRTLEALGQNLTHGASRIKICQENTNKSQIRYYGADASTKGSLEFMATTSDGSSSVTPLSIDSSGNVGINDTNPNTANLSIKGQSTGVSANYPMLKLLGQNTSSDGLHITTTGTGNNYYAIKVATGADSSAFNVTNAGNVGIGTDSPDDLLTLSASTCSYSTAPVVRFDSTCTDSANIRNWAIGPADSSYGNFHIFKSAARGGDPVNTAGIVATINYLGNVGIGTDSPSSKLVVRTSTDHNFEVEETGGELRLSALNNARSANIGLQFAASEFNFLTGNVGIGTTSPTQSKLVISGGTTGSVGGGDAGITMINKFDNPDNSWSILPVITGVSNTGFSIRDNTDSADRLVIDGFGKVGIGTTSPTGKLMISDANNRTFADAQFKIEGAGYTAVHYLDGTEYMIQQNSGSRRIRMMSGTTNGVLLNPGATAWASASDESLKENIKPLENVLDKIKDYRCVEYNFKSDKLKDKKIGFIAQDWVDDFAPIINEDDEGLLGMKYTETIPVLLKAIQELEAKIKILENK